MIKREGFLKLVLCLSALMVAVNLNAATNTLKSEAKIPTGRYSFETSYHVELGQSQGDTTESVSTTYFTQFKVTKNSDDTYGAINFYFDQELANNNNRESSSGKFRDVYADLGGPLKLIDSNYIDGQEVVLRGSLGNSEASQDKEKKSALGLIYQFKVPNKLLTFVQYHRLTRSFYTTEVTKAGDINNPWSYRYLTDMVYSLNKNIKLRATYVYDLHRSFQGVMKDSVITDFKAIHSLPKDMSVYLGLASVGLSTKEADGSTDRVPLVDEKNPTLYIGLDGNF